MSANLRIIKDSPGPFKMGEKMLFFIHFQSLKIPEIKVCLDVQYTIGTSISDRYSQ